MATRRSKIQFDSAGTTEEGMNTVDKEVKKEDAVESAKESSWRIILPQDRVDALSVIVQSIDGLTISDGKLTASPEKENVAKRLLFLATGDKGVL
jgi:hypothetical protein